MQAEEEDIRSEVKQARERVRNLRALDESLHGLLDGQGGCGRVLELEEGRLQRLLAKQRGAKPMAAQRSSAKAHAAKLEKQHSNAEAKLDQLCEKLAEARAAMEGQEGKVELLGSRLELARCELAAINERMAEEVPGKGRGTGHGHGSREPAGARFEDKVATIRGIISQVGELSKAVAAGNLELAVQAICVQARTLLPEEVDGAAQSVYLPGICVLGPSPGSGGADSGSARGTLRECPGFGLQALVKRAGQGIKPGSRVGPKGFAAGPRLPSVVGPEAVTPIICGFQGPWGRPGTMGG